MDTTRIVLGGKLGLLFGEEWQLDVMSPTEALRAIDANLGGQLRTYLGGEGAKGLYRVCVQRDDNDLAKEEIDHRSGRSDIYVLPAIEGANSGAGKIILGIALLAVAWWNPYAWGSVIIGAIGGMGASLVLGGVTQLLTPIPKDAASSEQRQSFDFQGAATATAQGVCVPIVYGRMLIAPVPIAIAFNTQDLSVTANVEAGGVETNPLPGGGYEFVPINLGTD